MGARLTNQKKNSPNTWRAVGAALLIAVSGPGFAELPV